MRQRIRRYLNHRHCKRHGHGVGCEIEVFNFAAGVLYENHTHTCPRCGTVTLDETKPISDPMRELLSDMGLAIPEQRTFYVN